MSVLDCIYETLKVTKAEKLTIIDFAHTHALIEVMIVCEVSNTRLMQAVVMHLRDACLANGHTSYHIEGQEDSEWLLFGCEDTVVSIFLKEACESYGLERLWHEYVRQ